MRALTAFPSSFLNLRQLEEVLYDLPPLEGVFLHWHTHGVTATTAGMYTLLARRKQLLGPTTLSGACLGRTRTHAALCMPVCSGMNRLSAPPRRRCCFRQGCWYTRPSRFQ
jgi:hypothetical protein